MSGYILVSLFVGIVALVAVARFCFIMITVVGHSMYPALKDGDKVLVLRYWPSSWLRHGHIVVGEYQHMLSKLEEKRIFFDDYSLTKSYFIKRITGLPNETVTIHISQLNEIIAADEKLNYDQNGYREWYIPVDCYFVESDSFGMDSLTLGPLSLDSYVGLVLNKSIKNNKK